MGNVADETITALGYEPKKNARDMTCLAVKAASLQSQPAANLYLAYLRQAFMVGGSDPSSLDTLIEIARHVSRRHPDMLNFQRFFEQFDCAQSRQALFEDRKKNQINRIVSMPTLTFTFLGKGIKLSGNCSYDSMVEAFQQLSKVATLPMHLSLSEKMLTYAYPNVRE
ncbi:Thioredoxin [Dyadobacter sp. SG02]|nr:Thioredoxin [Dyadobacter sp. SG02]